ncbi:hypothetical protein TI05_01220 [Achromatium sp. WMS3]|nr:hypothetical protein TI05_01220 [Achromatium sp. WMS3]
MIKLSKHFYGNWSIIVEPHFEAEVVGRGTLQLTDQTRTVSLASGYFQANDVHAGGQQRFTEKLLLQRFPPPELKGERVVHHHFGLVGVATWFKDTGQNYKLMGLTLSEPKQEFANCTVIFPYKHLDWAITTWKTIRIEKLPAPEKGQVYH